jgi:uncharacterized cupin superfamily protein
MNLYTDDWDVERRSVRIRHIGHRFDSKLIGGILLELRPGHRGPYHLHHGNEELAVVLAGAPSVRRADGEQRLATGDLAFFARGAEGLHALENHGDEPARVLLLSSKVAPDVTERPEDSLVGVFVGDVPTLGRDAPFEAFFPVDAARRG